MYLLGYDIGSSSIKAALVDAHSNQPIAVKHYPETEMSIQSPQSGWAEQDPQTWWSHLVNVTQLLLNGTAIDPALIAGIGISYQMHGLVMVDRDQQVVRPSIIWCDSRAVQTGEDTLEKMGSDYCYQHLLNTPGNFTASKLKWVKENEPEQFDRTHKIMLPGDYIVMRLTGEISTTISGLSEGIMWDFTKNEPSSKLLETMSIKPTILPDVHDTFHISGEVKTEAARALGIPVGVPVSYRAGDQPNNALSLGVLETGQVAGTGGTSGVVYGVHDTPVYDIENRVNTFAHVNYTKEKPMVGVLLCINGTGSQYRWVRQEIAPIGTNYQDMEADLQSIPVGSQGLHILPFGNGAERLFGNKEIGAQVLGLQFNRHQRPHLYRAALEGIAFSFHYGIEAMNNMGMNIQSMRVGNDNLFQSQVFSETLSTLLQGSIKCVETTGAIGAARAAGFAIGHFSTLKEAVSGDQILKTYHPKRQHSFYQDAYEQWKQNLVHLLNQ